ncbi:uncharacterized protein LOC135144360 [Zophobas morio]|jgi:hypothetical protein|uniref:uncharacterized protein LOC135144360 n=1 Tax=Zophobas morio TaxID=2755281 RepID=UPI0030826CE9
MNTWGCFYHFEEEVVQTTDFKQEILHKLDTLSDFYDLYCSNRLSTKYTSCVQHLPVKTDIKKNFLEDTLLKCQLPHSSSLAFLDIDRKKLAKAFKLDPQEM